MTVPYEQVLVTADDLVAQISDDNIFALTVRHRTLNDVYAHVRLHLRGKEFQASRGALLDLAARLELQHVELDPNPTAWRVTGRRGETRVELVA